MLEERRKQLYRVYQDWEKELKDACPQLIKKEYSHPYYLHIPDDWFDAEYRILIVGEEGFGNKQFDLPIEEDAFETLNGYIISLLEKVPHDDECETIERYGYLFEILKIENRIIREVRITKLA